MRTAFIVALFFTSVFANAQCVPQSDSTGCGIHPSFGFCPQIADVAVLGLPYDDTCTFFIPRASYYDFFLSAYVLTQFDSVQLRAFNNLPQGLMVECQLDTCMIYPDQDTAVDAMACIRIWGTPTSIPTSDTIEVEINAWLTMSQSGAINVGLPPRTFRLPMAQNCSNFLMAAVDGDDTSTPECEGNVEVEVFFGTPPYTYSYSTGDSGVASLDSLCPGLYSVTVTDGNGEYCSQLFAIPSDTNVYSNIIPGLPAWVDTLFNSTSQCDLDYTLPIDSFNISDATVVGSDTVLVSWNIYQLGQPYNVVIYYPYLANNATAYSLILYCQNGRSQTGVIQLYDYVNSTLVGVKDHQEPDMLNTTVYPNPTNSIITLQANIEFKLAHLTDLAGRRLMALQANGNLWQADLGTLPNGMYLIETVSIDGKRGVAKVIKD